MNAPTLKDFLASVIAGQLPASASGQTAGDMQRSAGPPGTKPVSKPGLPPLAERIADELVREALASGLPLTHQKVDKGRLGGGNTAEVVAQVTLHAPFAFKLDQATKKLAEEGETMRKIKANALPGVDLPARFRAAWPHIYAVRGLRPDEGPPYAYLMEFFPREDGWISLEDRLYPAGQGAPPSHSEAIRWIGLVLDTLFLGYAASVDRRHKPSLMADYFGRIRERLEKTAARDGRFASRALLVNHQRLRPWKRYLDEIERHYGYLEEITPPFTSVTHGDPNPGNLMLRATTAEAELKLIDPKDWMTGDYLFDVTKITHFLEGTGPVEKPEQGGPVKTAFAVNGAVAELAYTYGKPAWTELLVEACRERVAQFAARKESPDPHWAARYDLGTAANLLGLPLGRLDKGREDAALILYGEGLLWLDRFCARLGVASGQLPVVLAAGADEVEPEPLRRARAWVREQVPGVREAKDEKRGFQLLHWEPVRPNDKGKPVELSLEHEARLIPADDRAVMKLLEALSRSEGRPAGEHLLPKDSPFAALVVHRYEREPGAQSVDRYYDVPAAAGGAFGVPALAGSWDAPQASPNRLKPGQPTGDQRLISRQITVRERLRTSKFMTWSGTEVGPRALNLELPFVTLGCGGLTARLEFNWVDDLEICVREAMAADTPEAVRRQNPFFIAAQLEGLALEGLAPVLEHTTFRQKFGLRPAGAGADARDLLVVNVDTVVAQDLETRRVGTYWDVDLSGTQAVDGAELHRLADFAAALSARYGLKPNPGTKAWRDAQVTGLLERWKEA